MRLVVQQAVAVVYVVGGIIARCRRRPHAAPGEEKRRDYAPDVVQGDARGRICEVHQRPTAVLLPLAVAVAFDLDLALLGATISSGGGRRTQDAMTRGWPRRGAVAVVRDRREA